MNPSHIERPNYFAGEALLTADFASEQQYHINMQRHNNRALHTSGIANGLDVNWFPASTANQVSISAGMALDSEGREIILLQPVVLTLTGIEQNASYFLTIHYHETFSDYTDETGAAGYKRIVQQPQIDYLRNPPDPGLYILLAVIDFSSSGAINRLSYKAGKFERRYVGSVLGSVQFVTEGAGISQSRSSSALGSFINAPLAANSSISARKETSGDQSYLLVDAPRTQFSGLATTRGSLGVGVDQPNASLQVDATVFSGKAILLHSAGRNVTLSDTFTPFFELGDVLISNPSAAQGDAQRRVITAVNPAKRQVSVDRAFVPALDGIGFTYLRSTLARFSASNGLIGNGSLLHIDVNGSVGLGMQASLSEGTGSSGRSALVITPDRKVGIGMTGADPQTALDVNGDIAASGRVIANSFEGNGAKLKNLPMLSFWTKETVGSDTSKLFYDSGNVGIGCDTMPASLSVGGGKTFIGSGLISLLEAASDPFTVTGYQTRFTEQVNLGDTIATGQVIKQGHLILRIVSDTELHLAEQFPIPIFNSTFETQAQGSASMPTAQSGTISSNGTQIKGINTTFTSIAQEGDNLVIDGFNLTAPLSNWYVKEVVSDTKLTLVQRPGKSDAQLDNSNPVFSAIASAYIVTPALLAYFQADQGDQIHTGAIDTSMPAALLIASNGSRSAPPNTVAINVALADIDSRYALQINGDVSFGGQGHFTDLNTNTLEANQATIATASITRMATFSGQLNATQSVVATLGTGQPLQVGSWTSPATFNVTTDGFVIGVVGWPNNNPDAACVAWMFGSSGLTVMYAIGGNTNLGSNCTSFTLPLAAGSLVSLGMLQSTKNVVPAPVSAMWIPAGTGSGGPSIEQIESKPAGIPDPPDPIGGSQDSTSDLRLLTALGKILGKTISVEQGAEFLSALKRF